MSSEAISLDVPLGDDCAGENGTAIMAEEDEYDDDGGDDDDDDDDDNNNSYVAMEPLPSANIMPQTVNSTSEHDEYVSLNISRESDEDKKKSVYHKTTKQLAKAYAAIMKEEAALSRTIADIRLPGPIPEAGMRDIEEALMGDYKDRYYEEKGTLFRIPEASAFEARLKKSKADNLNMDSTARRYRFLVPFIIKAELSPGLAFAESMLTWTHFLSLISLFLSGFSIFASIVGGVSLFVSLTITHFWYGLSRYPSVWNNMVPKGLKGSKMDENFAEIRDVCSYFCNGHNRTKPQLGAFIISLPFTFLYHFNAFLTTLVYYSCGLPTAGSRFPSPIPLSIFISNFMMVCFWFLGGKVGFIATTAATIFNQNFYNSLLFKRSLKDFLLSFIFGNVLVIQDKRPDRIGEVIKGKQVIATAPKQTSSSIDIEGGETLDGSRASTKSKDQVAVGGDKSVVKENDGDVFSTSSSANSLVEKGRKDPAQARTSVEETRDLDASDMQDHQLQPTSDDSASSHKLQHLATINAASTEREATVREERTKEIPKSTSIMFAMPRRITATSQNDLMREEERVQDEFLNPSDIHLDIENHPGTVAFRNVVNDAIAKFPTKAYTFRKHNWIMKKLHGRYFFIREVGAPRRKLGRAEVKKRCKMFHDKQTLLRSEIAGILNDLKDLKKNHTNSKSNSDHSRNSKKVPPEITEKLSAILKNNSSHDQKDHRQQRNPHSRQNLESASTAKDSHGDSHVESSKESTISTLTQSNGTFPPTSGARSTPWMRGPADELKELNETTPAGDSTHLRDAINGLLEYTSWLENLNPLRESKVEDNEKTNMKDLTEQEGDELLTKRQQSGILSEGTGGANTGGVDKAKDPYWHTLVDEPPTKRNFITKFPKKEGKQRDDAGFDNSLEHRDLPLDTINWDKSTRKFIDSADVPPEERFRLIPLWRRALRNRKKTKESPRTTLDHSTNLREGKRGPSFWRKKKSSEANIVEVRSDKMISPRSRKMDPPASNWETVSPTYPERRDDENRAVQSPRHSKKRSSHMSPKSSSEPVIEERQDFPTTSLSPQIDQILGMDDDFLQQWDGESMSMNQTNSAASSKFQATVPSVKEHTGGSFAFCRSNGCDAFGACGLPNASTDADDIYDNE